MGEYVTRYVKNESYGNSLVVSILETLEDQKREDAKILSLNDLVRDIEEHLGIKLKGPRYMKFKELIDDLEEKQFIQIERVNTMKFCKLTPAGELYAEKGRFISLPRILDFLIDPLMYLYVFFFQTLPFMLFAALTGHLNNFFIKPGFFVLLVLTLNTPLLLRFYLHPLVNEIYGIDLTRQRYDLFHPIMTYHVNHGMEFRSKVNLGIRRSILLSFITNAIIAYLPIVEDGKHALGQYGIPMFKSPLLMFFNLLWFPLANFVLYMTFYILAFTGYWLITRPLMLPQELFNDKTHQLKELHKRILIVSILIMIGSEYLAIVNIMPIGAFPYKSVFLIMVFIVFGTCTVLITLWVLSYLRINSMITEKTFE